MDRQDIMIDDQYYQEILKWARLRNPILANTIENTKDVIIDNINNESKHIIKKDSVKEDDALDLLYLFLDNEQYSTTDEECIYFGNLAEVWRPIAEGSLI